MFCIKCGKELPQEAAFCFACGAKVYNDNGGSSDGVDSSGITVPSEDSYLYTFSGREKALKFVMEYISDSAQARSICNFFYSGGLICHPSGKLYGFTYSHKPEYRNEKNYYYNLYEYDLKNDSYKFLGGGSRGGIESLYIYNNVAYWKHINIYRLDLSTGKFEESQEQWLVDEFEEIKNKPKF